MKTMIPVILIIGFFVAIHGATNIFAGFHNSDMGWNLAMLECINNETYHDYGTDGIARIPRDMILLGTNQIYNLGFFELIAGCLLVGIGIGSIITDEKEEERTTWAG